MHPRILLLKRYYFGPEAELPEIEMLTEDAETLLDESKKPVDNIIKSHQSFFDNLYDIKHIIYFRTLIKQCIPPVPSSHRTGQRAFRTDEMACQLLFPERRKRLYRTIRRAIAHLGFPTKIFRLSDIQIKSN